MFLLLFQPLLIRHSSAQRTPSMQVNRVRSSSIRLILHCLNVCRVQMSLSPGHHVCFWLRSFSARGLGARRGRFCLSRSTTRIIVGNIAVRRSVYELPHDATWKQRRACFTTPNTLHTFSLFCLFYWLGLGFTLRRTPITWSSGTWESCLILSF